MMQDDEQVIVVQQFVGQQAAEIAMYNSQDNCAGDRAWRSALNLDAQQFNMHVFTLNLDVVQ